jgi:hypothetical protein
VESWCKAPMRQIAPGQTIKLAPGAKIDFVSTEGEVG